MKGAFLVSNPVYCDNKPDSDECKVINDYKKELRLQIGEFPSEASQCMYQIYTIVNAFDNLTKYFETSDMKLLLECAESIKTNCSFITVCYPKEELLRKIEIDAHLDSSEDRKLLFVKYYDKFFSEVAPIIRDYCSKIDKVIVPQIHDFFEVK